MEDNTLPTLDAVLANPTDAMNDLTIAAATESSGVDAVKVRFSNSFMNNSHVADHI
jgi:hypothetical protein